MRQPKPFDTNLDVKLMTHILRSLKLPSQKQEGPKIISAMNRYAWEMHLTLEVSPQQQKYSSSALIKKIAGSRTQVKQQTKF